MSGIAGILHVDGRPVELWCCSAGIKQSLM
jgi:hypothetical protein